MMCRLHHILNFEVDFNLGMIKESVANIIKKHNTDEAAQLINISIIIVFKCYSNNLYQTC